MTSLQRITFSVGDRVDGPHRVTFTRHDRGHVSAACTCQEHPDAADRCCAHSRRLLAGDASDLVSDNAIEVEVLEWWLACMDTDRAAMKVRAA